MTFVHELKRIKKVLFAAVSIEELDGKADSGTGSGERQSSNSISLSSATQGSMDLLLKRLMKFKHLEEDNKKLKNLLK
jgi:hypothetical protein